MTLGKLLSINFQRIEQVLTTVFIFNLKHLVPVFHIAEELAFLLSSRKSSRPAKERLRLAASLVQSLNIFQHNLWHHLPYISPSNELSSQYLTLPKYRGLWVEFSLQREYIQVLGKLFLLQSIKHKKKKI